MPYEIKKLQEQKAKALGVTIKPSTRKTKKIDVFKDGKKISSVGGVKKDGSFYMDYASYIEDKGLSYADQRRKLYLNRHSKDKDKKADGSFTNGYYAKKILW